MCSRTCSTRVALEVTLSEPQRPRIICHYPPNALPPPPATHGLFVWQGCSIQQMLLQLGSGLCMISLGMSMLGLGLSTVNHNSHARVLLATLCRDSSYKDGRKRAGQVKVCVVRMVEEVICGGDGQMGGMRRWVVVWW